MSIMNVIRRGPFVSLATLAARAFRLYVRGRTAILLFSTFTRYYHFEFQVLVRSQHTGSRTHENFGNDMSGTKVSELPSPPKLFQA